MGVVLFYDRDIILRLDGRPVINDPASSHPVENGAKMLLRADIGLRCALECRP
jgi:hypothetical protein